MVPLLVIVIRLFEDRTTQMGLAQGRQSIKTLALDRKHKSLRESVQVRTVCGQPHRLDASRAFNSDRTSTIHRR